MQGPHDGCDSPDEPRSIYEQALGGEFGDLHPKIRERFGFDSTDGVACVGEGRMEVVRNGGPWALPFLYLGTLHNNMFPEQNTAVPFRVYNFAYRDRYGRETITWLRSFELPRKRRFDARMIYSETRDRVVDYMGTHQHLAVDIHLSVSDRGGMQIRTGDQRLYLLGRGTQLPPALTAQADVHEWYDGDQYRISVEVTNPVVGTVFEYRGSFRIAWIEPSSLPAGIRPQSATRRE